MTCCFHLLRLFGLALLFLLWGDLALHKVSVYPSKSYNISCTHFLFFVKIIRDKDTNGPEVLATFLNADDFRIGAVPGFQPSFPSMSCTFGR